MIVQCLTCHQFFDDEFRNTTCQHEAFLANDGQNKFSIHEEAWLADHEPLTSYDKWVTGGTSYQNWLNEQEIKSNGK